MCRYLEDKAGVRVRAVTFLLKLAWRCSASEELRAQLCDYILPDLVDRLLQEVKFIDAIILLGDWGEGGKERTVVVLNPVFHRSLHAM